MRKPEISTQEVSVFLMLTAQPGRWWTSGELGDAANVPARTVRAYLTSYVAEGFARACPLTTGYRYQINTLAPGYQAFHQRLTTATDVLTTPYVDVRAA